MGTTSTQPGADVVTLITTTVSTQGTEPTHDELRRRQREAFAMRSGWPELRRADLTFRPVLRHP